MAKWWVEGKQFQSRDTRIYPTTNLRESYVYAVAMVSRLYGEENAAHFK